MKKIIITLVFSLSVLFSGCIITNDFTSSYRLGLSAIENGSVSASLEYAQRLKTLAETPEQKAIAHMISGYSYFLNQRYSEALDEFDQSLDYDYLEESIAGTILNMVLLKQYDLVEFQLEVLDQLHNDWVFTVNHEDITKTELYEFCALSFGILQNKSLFDSLKTEISTEKMQKMEGFFFD